MNDFRRDYPTFALCGLSCGLCPRYHTEGKSRCPGCGGPGFSGQHPTCAVVTCSKKHGDVEFCADCVDFPCDRFRNAGEKDSFITYRNVVRDLRSLKSIGIEEFTKVLEEKIGILEYLLAEANDGRSKNLYCLAVNLLDLPDLKNAVSDVKAVKTSDPKVRAAAARKVLEEAASRCGVELKLRK